MRTFFTDLWPDGAPVWPYPPSGAAERQTRAGAAGQSPRTAAAPKVVRLTVQQAYAGVEISLGELRIRIPPGARNGMRFKVPAPVWEVETQIAVDRRFNVNGDDLEIELRVKPKIAARGGELRVPHPAGPLLATLPAGLKDGQTLRLRGRGMPATATRHAGDLVIRVRSA